MLKTFTTIYPFYVEASCISELPAKFTNKLWLLYVILKIIQTIISSSQGGNYIEACKT